MRKKFYLTLDTETATLPFVSMWNLNARDKQKIAIAKPLVYDIGWVITDTQGNIVKKVNYLVQETFFVPNVFNTAYYKDKRPIYMAMLSRGEIFTKCWNDIIAELVVDLEFCDMATAYNACFDYKKAIPFTESYIYHLYSTDYTEWENLQKKKCESLLNGAESKNDEYLNPYFKLRGKEYPIVDLWGLSCERLINIDKYRNYCLDNGLLTNSALYFKSSAETSFQYLMKNHSFVEDHTALSDAMIEAQILAKALKKGKVEPSLYSFPFRVLGTTYEYVAKHKKYTEVLKEALESYLETLSEFSSYYSKIENILAHLQSGEWED